MSLPVSPLASHPPSPLTRTLSHLSRMAVGVTTCTACVNSKPSPPLPYKHTHTHTHTATEQIGHYTKKSLSNLPPAASSTHLIFSVSMPFFSPSLLSLPSSSLTLSFLIVETCRHAIQNMRSTTWNKETLLRHSLRKFFGNDKGIPLCKHSLMSPCNLDT